MKKYASVLVVLLLFAACKVGVNPPDPLQNYQTAAKALNDISLAANAAGKAVLIVMPDNTSDRQQILGILQKIVEADQSGITIVRQLTSLSSADSQNLSLILAPVFAQFHAAVDSGLLGFKDPTMKAKVGVYIDAISASITIIEGILKASTANGFEYNRSIDYACRPGGRSFGYNDYAQGSKDRSYYIGFNPAYS